MTVRNDRGKIETGKIKSEKLFMNQKKLSVWLKAIIICAGIIGIFAYACIVYGLCILYAGKTELKAQLTGWLVFALISALPCLAALISAWKIACEISRDNSFSHKNAKLMRNIAVYAFIDGIYVFIGNLITLALKMSRSSIFIVLMLATAGGLIIAVATACLSHLIEKAAKLKDENDCII